MEQFVEDMKDLLKHYKQKHYTRKQNSIINNIEEFVENFDNNFEKIPEKYQEIIVIKNLEGENELHSIDEDDEESRE